MMSESSKIFIKTATEADDIRDAGLTVPEDIVRYTDILYGADPKWQVLDVYLPADAAGKLPVIFDVHGGGWVYGDKDRYQYYCMDLARRGFAVVNFTYRLAPDHKFPSQFEDINLAAAFTVQYADKYGFDLDYVFGMGDSAGAHMLGVYTNILTNPGYAKQFPFSVNPAFRFKAVALNCGCYDIEADKNSSTPELMTDLFEGEVTKEALNMINVPMHMTGAFPPVYVMTAEGDFLKPQMPILTRKMLQLEIPFKSAYYRSPEGPLGHVFHLNIRGEQARICNDDICVFFRSFMSGEGV